MIKIFKDVEAANDFMETVKVSDCSYLTDGTIIVQYEPFITPEQARARKIREDENDTLVGLERAEMHLEFLNALKKERGDAGNKKDSQTLDKGITETLQSIDNYKIKLKAIEGWKTR